MGANTCYIFNLREESKTKQKIRNLELEMAKEVQNVCKAPPFCKAIKVLEINERSQQSICN